MVCRLTLDFDTPTVSAISGIIRCGQPDHPVSFQVTVHSRGGPGTYSSRRSKESSGFQMSHLGLRCE
jgi:hypothetical protein